MAGTAADEGGRKLALVEGGALLTVVRRDLGAVVVDELQVEFPGVTALPNGGGGPPIHNRRGRLRAASLFVARERLERRAAEAGGLPWGLARVRVAVEPGRLLLEGEVGGGGESPAPALLKARLALAPGTGWRLRISVEDASIEGAGGTAYPPLSLARAAVESLLGVAAGATPGAAAPDAAAALELDALGAALDEVFVADGYRLPDLTDLRLATVAVTARGVELVWSLAGAPPAVGAPDTMEALASASADAGDFPRVVEILERRLELAAASPAEQREILVRLAEVYDGPLSRPDRARAAHERALAIEPGFAPSRTWLARDAWVRGDAETALAFVRPVPVADLPDDGLVLRADLGERRRSLEDAVPALEELRARAQSTGQAFAVQELEARLIVLQAGPLAPEGPAPAGAGSAEPPSAASVEELERRLSADPQDGTAASELAGRYIAIDDPARRAEALSSLLRRAIGLSAERRKSIYAALGESAEAGGDLAGAEQAYWRAASIEAEPTLRANYQVAHARMLIARGDVKTATAELDAALAGVPEHGGATALAADLSYRMHDFARARHLYATLDGMAGAADVIPRELLVQRRAALAHRLGDASEAESLYRELAILNPQHADARRALAELARGRGDFAGAAQRLEEALRLLPLEAAADVTDVRHRLAAIYVEMREWAAARHHLELVVAQDPGRVAALELLLETYERLGAHVAAAAVCERLARLLLAPADRAAALYRQAELYRTHLDDPARALDAYLRSSDLDPGFVPSRLRLVDHYWEVGDLEVVADLANDLAALPIHPQEDPDLVARLAIASSHPRAGGPSRFPFREHPALAAAAVRALVDAAALAEGRSVDALDTFITRARAWAGAAGQSLLVRLLVEQVLETPARPAPALALARLAELSGRLALAGAAYGLLAYIAPHSPAARHLENLASPGAVRPDAVKIGGLVDHPDLTAPARRALARLASPLLGFRTEAPAPKPIDGSGIPPNRATELRRIGDLIGAPPFIVVRDDGTVSSDDRRRLRVIPTHPAGLMIGPAAATLNERAWGFVAGRALETLRSGLRTAGLAGSDALPRVLEGARAALSRTPTPDPLAREVADWLAMPDAALALGSDEQRAATLIDVERALAALPDWATFVRGALHTRNRIGLIACGRPNEALTLMKAEDREGPRGQARDARTEYLQRPAARELLRFMLSPEYEQAFDPDPGPAPGPPLSPPPTVAKASS